MNNIGSVIKCEICVISLVLDFQISGSRVRILPKDGVDQLWKKIPIHSKSTSCLASPEKSSSGILYQHQCNTLLPTHRMNIDLCRYIEECTRIGCLIRYRDANDRIRVLGTKEYPLTGTLEEISGSKPTDLSGYQLRLSSTCLHPAPECIID